MLGWMLGSIYAAWNVLWNAQWKTPFYARPISWMWLANLTGCHGEIPLVRESPNHMTFEMPIGMPIWMPIWQPIYTTLRMPVTRSSSRMLGRMLNALFKCSLLMWNADCMLYGMLAINAKSNSHSKCSFPMLGWITSHLLVSQSGQISSEMLVPMPVEIRVEC